MILNEQRKRNRRHKLTTFIGVILTIVLVVVGLHAYGVWYVKDKTSDLKEFADEFKQNAKEFAPTKEDVKEGTKEGVDKVLDFLIKGSKYVDENITKPAVEISNELAREQMEKAEKGDSVIFERVTYWNTIDGDTIKVMTEYDQFITVRLIGINTPESVASDEYLSQKGTVNSEYGKMASEWTKDYLDEMIFANFSEICLEYDLETKDDYGRTLAYVWLSNDVDPNNEEDVINHMLNAQIIKNGYAEDVVYEPNHKYAHIFARLRHEAENSKIGLWQFDDIGEYY